MDTTQLSFEVAMQQLEELVRQLENSRLSLEEAIAAFEKGARLKAYCEQKLQEAKLRIETIDLNHKNKDSDQKTEDDVNLL
jgi:exodeoxyribonuclease VII small subunit